MPSIKITHETIKNLSPEVATWILDQIDAVGLPDDATISTVSLEIALTPATIRTLSVLSVRNERKTKKRTAKA